jgi:hypothetical protein
MGGDFNIDPFATKKIRLEHFFVSATHGIQASYMY